MLEARRELERRGVAVLGISRDAPAAQKKFSEREELDYPLLSDPDAAVAAAWGVWGEKTMYGKKGMGITRSAFLIDEEGRILGAWYGVKPEDTASRVLEMIGAEGS